MEIDVPGKPNLYQPYDLPGWEIIGTVKIGAIGTGALGRNLKTGEYGQINAGVVRRLDGRQVQRLLGGLGRPKSEPRTDFERRLRERMDATQIPTYAALSEASGVSIQTLNNVCRGTYKPSLDTVKKLSEALSCTVDDLI